MSVILIGLLVLQAACVRPMGPPVPLRPEDPDQREAIGNAFQVRITAVDGSEYRLEDASIEDRRLIGERRNRSPKGNRADIGIPVDSIAEIQLHRSHYRWLLWAAPLTAVVTAAIVFIATFDMPGCILCGGSG